MCIPRFVFHPQDGALCEGILKEGAGAEAGFDLPNEKDQPPPLFDPPPREKPPPRDEKPPEKKVQKLFELLMLSDCLLAQGVDTLFRHFCCVIFFNVWN